MTFPRWGILSDGVVGELRTLEPAIGGSESSLLPTILGASTNPAAHGQSNGTFKQEINRRLAMLPTPNARDYKDTGVNTDYRKLAGKSKLAGKIAMLHTPKASDAIGTCGDPKRQRDLRADMKIISMLPTCTSRDHKDTGNMENVPVNALLGRELGKNHGLKLQPAFAEWMQGFPIGWTDLED
jgi:hypothetical protein